MDIEYEKMVAMTTGDRKKNIKEIFRVLKESDMGLSPEQESVIKFYMEVNLCS